MNTKLVKHGENLWLLVSSGEVLRVSPGDAREFLLNFADTKYNEKQSFGLNIGGQNSFGGEVIAEIDNNGSLVIKSAQTFKDIIIKAETEFLSVPEFAKLYGKSDTMVRRMCQNGRIPGVILKGNVYLIPAHATYPPNEAKK